MMVSLFATSSAADLFWMYVNTTFAPSRASACTMARPMPRLPPVTIAVLPENIRKDLATIGSEITKAFSATALLSGGERKVDLGSEDDRHRLSVQISGFVLPMRYRFDCRLDQHRGSGNDFHLVHGALRRYRGFKNDCSFIAVPLSLRWVFRLLVVDVPGPLYVSTAAAR